MERIATRFLLVLGVGCLSAGCPLPTAWELGAFSKPGVKIHRGPDGTWDFEADSDFKGSGKITAAHPDGTNMTVDISADSQVSAVTLAQGQRAAESGVVGALAQMDANRMVLYGNLAAIVGQAIHDAIPLIVQALTPKPPSPQGEGKSDIDVLVESLTNLTAPGGPIGQDPGWLALLETATLLRDHQGSKP